MKVLLDEGAFAPERAHDTDAGYDLRTPRDCYCRPHDTVTINTGVHIQLPHGTCGTMFSKSGLNVKFSILSTGLIDEGYTGAIRVKLYNHGDEPHMFERGDKISQIVIQPCLYEPVEIVSELDESERGENGFGSTGR